MKNTKTYWFMPFIKYNPDDYEEWLEQKAAEGWHPVKVQQISSIAMKFEKGEPKLYRYVADMQAVHRKDYRPTYEAFGWEHMGQMSSMHLWRREYEVDRPEAFTDAASKRARSKRFGYAVSFSFVLFTLAFIALAVLLGVLYPKLDADDVAQFIVGIVLTALFAVPLGIITFDLLKKKPK